MEQNKNVHLDLMGICHLAAIPTVIHVALSNPVSKSIEVTQNLRDLVLECISQQRVENQTIIQGVMG
jgi:hypothetical protein